jgi:phage gp29-like protein
MAVNIAQEDHIFWYPDADSCRLQVREAGLKIVSEWVTSQTTLPPPADREAAFRRGNYVAVAVSASGG